MESLNPCSIVEGNNSFQLNANANTDFICKYEEYVKDSASFYYQTKKGDFTMLAKLTSMGGNAFDAAFLMVRQDTRKWIKLAVELGVDQSYNVVSVITDPWSDDANGELLDGNCCWLRISRKNNFFGLHYSLDGKKWRFVRAFGMEMNASISVGFGIQSPKGDNCKGIIEEFSLSNQPVDNFRNGN
ncbi:hypothetical protein BZG02_09575 [Labilibaculum filiforme]|uniref:DUF1349 domain-containing protein n=1 Tax=Labilibaculum filiforme TaxID=1940526 RepID=A0A2N3HYD5_9BACT|nr:DUF1349 domain-containing protein [Labilibaculum filiforme]PKQ63013.1 hypothetical protein BZG02_09575 [Labilibaculum filiforme]